MAYRKLGRTSAHRKSMLRNLTTDLIVNGRIVIHHLSCLCKQADLQY